MSSSSDAFGRPAPSPSPGITAGDPLGDAGAPAPMPPPPAAESAGPQYSLADWGQRLGAWVIDVVVLLAVFAPLFLVVMAVADGGENTDSSSFIAVGVGALALWVLASLLYAPMLMRRPGARNGQTWGKQALGIRVVRDDGQAVGFGFAAYREVLIKGFLYSAVGQIPVLGLIANLVAYLWPLWEPENRAAHDLMVKSHVVHA